jgi:hypothetical protein
MERIGHRDPERESRAGEWKGGKGRIIARLGLRALAKVIVAYLGRGVALLAIPIAAWLGSLSIEILFAVGFLCGVQNVVGGAAYQVLLPGSPVRGSFCITCRSPC